ncbi:hypothetical protein [Glaciimonas immobilis]|uniref:Uncharacterized protein n=1 Tax=Glaciimonas immobilis TaxID=728004 RepID=A0A840RQ30_9BURK|nr:hypothetical protein [Glaciimonas immobilis]KAF3996989.1 hypothetical protein HAV38_15010 [Glaciimonas immobilis]MBB5199823.1 hypothetical protein [Glaciimonas immobilis]
MATSDLLTIIATLRAEFAYVSLYVVGGQGILIATNDAARAHASPALMSALDTSVDMQAVHALAGRNFTEIAADLLLSPAQIDRLLQRFGANGRQWISTDNNLKLEYNTPKANANSQDRSSEINLKVLRAAQKEGSINVEQSAQND